MNNCGNSNWIIKLKKPDKQENIKTVTKHTIDIGAADPELNTSPIAEENDELTDILRQQVPGEPMCFFNNQGFTNGDYIISGSTRLKCDYGIWIPSGPANTDNP